jgi:hypothetical protein
LFGFLKFQFKFCWEFELLAKRKVVPFEFILHLEKFGNFLWLEKIDFVFSKLGQLWIFGKHLINWKRVTSQPTRNSVSHRRLWLSQGPPGQIITARQAHTDRAAGSTVTAHSFTDRLRSPFRPRPRAPSNARPYPSLH